MSRTRFEMGAGATVPPGKRGRMASITTTAPDKARGTRFIRPGQNATAGPERQARTGRKTR